MPDPRSFAFIRGWKHLMSKTRLAFGWGFVGGSLLALVLTVWAYASQPDYLAAFTVYPFWLWGGIGLGLSVAAFCLLHSRPPIIVTAVWLLTLCLGMDEAKALSNLNRPKLTPKRVASGSGPTLIRVVTVNCGNFAFGDPVEELRKWDPDIVILQQVFPHRVKQMAETLYGGGGDFRAYRTNGIITRFGISHEVRWSPITPNQQVTIRLPDGREIEVVNVHLATAATDMRVWSGEERKLHRMNRKLRKTELSDVLAGLRQTTPFPSRPTILGGDFNSSATDVVHRQLTRDFGNTFAESGRGWGNTFHRRFPILRIDHIYATRRFDPVSSRVVPTKTTDHRMVISDLLLRK
jgi:endonuclease/exonuclease/phosphatase (EEP) superfamily protein YafD